MNADELLPALLAAKDEEALDHVIEAHALNVDRERVGRVRDLLTELMVLLENPADDRWAHLTAAYETIVHADRSDTYPTVPPNPATPETESLPPPALASVIAGLPPMTLVSYAALCASSDTMPTRLAETHAKFGVVSQAARDALDLAWQAKLNDDERLHQLWHALTQQFGDWLKRLR